MFHAADEIIPSFWVSFVSLPLDPASAGCYLIRVGNALTICLASMLANVDVLVIDNEALDVRSPVIHILSTGTVLFQAAQEISPCFWVSFVSIPLDPATTGWFLEGEGNALGIGVAGCFANVDVLVLDNEATDVSSPVIDTFQALGVYTCGRGKFRIIQVSEFITTDRKSRISCTFKIKCRYFNIEY